MKKSFLLTVVMILMFSIQSYGVIDTVFVPNVANSNVSLDGITVKVYQNGVNLSQNITSTQGSIHGRCLLNVPTVIKDTIKIVPISPIGGNSTPIYTFNPTEYKTVVTTATHSMLINFFAYPNITSIDTVSVFNTNSNAPLAGITVKAYKNGIFGDSESQNTTTSKGLCIFNIPAVYGDTIKIVPQDPEYTFSPLQAKTNVIQLFFGIYTCIKSFIFYAHANVTSIAPSIFNSSKSNIASINNYSNVLSYNLTNNCLVSIAYYDLQGRLLRIIINQKQDPGNYSLSLPISNYPSGVYLQKFSADDFIDRKIVIIP